MIIVTVCKELMRDANPVTSRKGGVRTQFVSIIYRDGLFYYTGKAEYRA